MQEKEVELCERGGSIWCSHFDSIRKSRESWDSYFLNLIDQICQKSKDPNTKVGCIIIGEGREIKTSGYNSFPRGLRDDVPERLLRPEKYNWIAHAEHNAIYNASRNGVSLMNGIMYLHGLPCVQCSIGIIQSGIKEIVYRESDVSTSPFYVESLKKSLVMLSECGVKLRCIQK